MALPVIIVDASTGREASVNDFGVLSVGATEFDESYNVTAAVANTAYNLIEPKADKQFVVTGLLIVAKKDVTTDELIDIYEATSPTSTTIAKTILQVELLKSQTLYLSNLNMIVTKGRWVNAKADDATTLVTLFGHYVPETKIIVNED